MLIEFWAIKEGFTLLEVIIIEQIPTFGLLEQYSKHGRRSTGKQAIVRALNLRTEVVITLQ